MITTKFKITGKFKNDKWKIDYHRAMTKAMDLSVNLAETEVINQAIRKGLKFQGFLIKSIHGKVVRIDKGVVAIEGTASKYGEVMNDGRRPGRYVPIQPLFRWVWLKLRKKSSSVNEFINRKPKRGRIDDTTRRKQRAYGLAIAISKTIKKKGIKGRKYIDIAQKNVTPKINKIFKSTIDKIEKELSN